MGQSKVIRPRIQVMLSLASKRFLECIDFASAIACVWTIFWLIYFTFVKDFIEVFVYATFKYINRFRWLYRILQIDNLLKCIHDSQGSSVHCYLEEAVNLLPKKPSESSPEINVSVNCATGQFLNCTCGTPQSFKTRLMINPRAIDFTDEPSGAETNLKKRMNLSSVENTERTEKPILLSSEENAVVIPEENALLIPEENAILSPEEYAVLGPEEYTVLSPEDNVVFGSEQNVVLSPGKHLLLGPGQDKILISEENTILSPDDKHEQDSVFSSPKQRLGFTGKFFPWSFNKIRGSFRNESNNKLPSANCVKVKYENLATKVAEVQPTGGEYKERLIISSDSPGSVACCSSLFVCFKPKLKMKEIVPGSIHYKRF